MGGSTSEAGFDVAGEVAGRGLDDADGPAGPPGADASGPDAVPDPDDAPGPDEAAEHPAINAIAPATSAADRRPARRRTGGIVCSPAVRGVSGTRPSRRSRPVTE
jgi:hypothetical protein